METNKEIEVKFIVPQEIGEDKLIPLLKDIISGESWQILSERTDRRSYLYYDTPRFEVYKNNETLRRVGGFDKRINRGGFRYDYKTGPLDCRQEAKHWSDRVLSSEEIIKELSLPFQRVMSIAPVETYHRLLDIKKGSTQIELKFDDYDLFAGERLKELELEVMQGEEKSLQELCEVLQTKLQFKVSKEQKYTRIVNIKDLKSEEMFYDQELILRWLPFTSFFI